MPWEYRYGMRQWLLPLLLAGPMKLGDLIAPASDLYLMLPRMAVAMLSISIMAAALKLGNGISRLHGLVAMFVAAIWFEFVHFAAHTLTEPLATAVFRSEEHTSELQQLMRISNAGLSLKKKRKTHNY